MTRNADVPLPLPLFASPRNTVKRPVPSSPGDDVVLRSAEPLGGHPVTVMHSVREHARTDPDYPLAAERHPDQAGGWRTCGYGDAVAAADSIGQALLDRGDSVRTGRCSSCPGTAWTTC